MVTTAYKVSLFFLIKLKGIANSVFYFDKERDIMYQSYNEMRRIAEKYYNDFNYCTVIALAVCCNVGIGKAYHTMKRAGRKHKHGARFGMIYDGVKALGYKTEAVDNVYNKQVKSLSKLLPNKGHYMVHIRGHILAVRDGEVLDWSAGRSHRIIAAYKIYK